MSGINDSKEWQDFKRSWDEYAGRAAVRIGEFAESGGKDKDLHIILVRQLARLIVSDIYEFPPKKIAYQAHPETLKSLFPFTDQLLRNLVPTFDLYNQRISDPSKKEDGNPPKEDSEILTNSATRDVAHAHVFSVLERQIHEAAGAIKKYMQELNPESEPLKWNYAAVKKVTAAFRENLIEARPDTEEDRVRKQNNWLIGCGVTMLAVAAATTGAVEVIRSLFTKSGEKPPESPSRIVRDAHQNQQRHSDDNPPPPLH